MLQGLSKYFGDHNLLVYPINFIPGIFKGLIPFCYLGVIKYAKDQFSSNQSPEIVYKCVFYIFFFSMIGHKEQRFMLPIAPFLFLLMGYFLVSFTKQFPRLVRFYLWVVIVLDTGLFIGR